MESVAYSYGEELLSELNISISQGSFYFLTGPSGSGKTTFLKMCYGSLIQHRASSVFLVKTHPVGHVMKLHISGEK